jgi:hypothetical protein
MLLLRSRPAAGPGAGPAPPGTTQCARPAHAPRRHTIGAAAAAEALSCSAAAAEGAAKRRATGGEASTSAGPRAQEVRLVGRTPACPCAPLRSYPMQQGQHYPPRTQAGGPLCGLAQSLGLPTRLRSTSTEPRPIPRAHHMPVPRAPPAPTRSSATRWSRRLPARNPLPPTPPPPAAPALRSPRPGPRSGRGCSHGGTGAWTRAGGGAPRGGAPLTPRSRPPAPGGTTPYRWRPAWWSAPFRWGALAPCGRGRPCGPSSAAGAFFRTALEQSL